MRKEDSLMMKTVGQSGHVQTVGKQYAYVHVSSWSEFSEHRELESELKENP